MQWSAGYHDGYLIREVFSAGSWEKARQWLLEELDQRVLVLEAQPTYSSDVAVEMAELSMARADVAGLPQDDDLIADAGRLTFWITSEDAEALSLLVDALAPEVVAIPGPAPSEQPRPVTSSRTPMLYEGWASRGST